MKRLVGLLVLIVVVVGVIGFARGWFLVTSTREETTNRVDVSLTVDEDKMRSDTASARREASELTDKTANTLRGLGNTIDEAQTDEALTDEVHDDNVRTDDPDVILNDEPEVVPQ